METSRAANDDATPSLIFEMASGEERTSRTFSKAGTSFDPVRNRDRQACAFVADHSHSRLDRDTIINRLLDWSEEARRAGRVRRAEFLVCLAWEAYDRVR